VSNRRDYGIANAGAVSENMGGDIMPVSMTLGPSIGMTGMSLADIVPANMDILKECSTCRRVRVERTDWVEDCIENKTGHLCPCGGLWAALAIVPRYSLVVRHERRLERGRSV